MADDDGGLGHGLAVDLDRVLRLAEIAEAAGGAVPGQLEVEGGEARVGGDGKLRALAPPDAQPLPGGERDLAPGLRTPGHLDDEARRRSISCLAFCFLAFAACFFFSFSQSSQNGLSVLSVCGLPPMITVGQPAATTPP